MTQWKNIVHECWIIKYIDGKQKKMSVYISKNINTKSRILCSYNEKYEDDIKRTRLSFTTRDCLV